MFSSKIHEFTVFTLSIWLGFQYWHDFPFAKQVLNPSREMLVTSKVCMPLVYS